MHKITALTIGAFLLALAAGVAVAQDQVVTYRSQTPIEANAEAPRMSSVEDSVGRRQVRNYPEQPPTIPHKIDGYQIDINSNRCLTCHARAAVGESQAPMVSITHFMDRDGNFLAAVSPRRYFCNQCHVIQLQVKPLVENEFIDIDALLSGQDAN